MAPVSSLHPNPENPVQAPNPLTLTPQLPLPSQRTQTSQSLTLLPLPSLNPSLSSPPPLLGIEPTGNMVKKKAEFTVETISAGQGDVLVYVDDPAGHREEVGSCSFGMKDITGLWEGGGGWAAGQE